MNPYITRTEFTKEINRLDQKIDNLEKKMDQKIDNLEKKMDQKFAEVDQKFAEMMEVLKEIRNNQEQKQ